MHFEIENLPFVRIYIKNFYFFAQFVSIWSSSKHINLISIKKTVSIGSRILHRRQFFPGILPNTVHFAWIQRFFVFVDPAKHHNAFESIAVKSCMCISLLVHACHFLEFIFWVFWFVESPLTELAGMHHFAAYFYRFVNDWIVKWLVFNVIVVVVASSAEKNEVALHEKCQHFIERRLHTWPIYTQMKYLLGLFV